MVQKKVVDFHIHYSPRELVQDKLKELSHPDDKKVRYLNGIPSSTIHEGICQLERHLALMDNVGVDVAVISSAEGMRGDLSYCKIVNDELHQAMKQYPGRIVGMAHTDPLGGEEGMKEIERGIVKLGLKGVAIPSTINGLTVDDKALWPFYEKVEELNTFLFIHPALAVPSLGLEGFKDYDLYRTVGREFDLTLATIRLICGGVLDDFPNLNIVISHFGGALSSLLGRIKSYQHKGFWGLAEDPIHGRTCKEPFESYLSRMYFDTGGHFGDMNTVKAALQIIPAERMLFGSDYPQEIREQGEYKEFIDNLQKLPLSEKQISGLLSENALNLIK